MIFHRLFVGQTIYDIEENIWGEITSIGDGEEEEVFTDDSNLVVAYIFETEMGIECQRETKAYNAYPLVADKRFKGEDVCIEIRMDEFDNDHNYDYYCPEYDENCWRFETTDIWE